MSLRAATDAELRIRDNATCPYCLQELVPGAFNVEHVVGRRFVQRGTLDGCWNLKLRACRRCNSDKSDLENDISAISMHHSAAGTSPRSDADFVADARRKAKRSFSRRTKKPVAESVETFTIETSPFPGAVFTFRGSTQPQADKNRIFHLAWFHVAAFFYHKTYDASLHSGAGLPGVFAPALPSFKSDWGNDVNVAFMTKVASWTPLVLAGTARGLFKIVIRKQPNASCFAWAVEWNESMRVIGWFGDEHLIENQACDLPKFNVDWVTLTDGSHLAVRQDVLLEPDRDQLFFWRDDEGNEFRA